MCFELIAKNCKSKFSRRISEVKDELFFTEKFRDLAGQVYYSTQPIQLFKTTLEGKWKSKAEDPLIRKKLVNADAEAL